MSPSCGDHLAFSVDSTLSVSHTHTPSPSNSTCLDQELLNLVLEGLDLALKLRALVSGDRSCNDRAGHAARAAERLLGGHEHVGNVLVLAQEWEVEENLKWLSVGSHDNKFGDATVKRLGGLVGTLLELLVVARLLDQLEDGHGQVGGRQREGLGVDFRLPHQRKHGTQCQHIACEVHID